VVLVDDQVAGLVEAHIPHSEHSGPPAGRQFEDPAESRLQGRRSIPQRLDRPVQIGPAARQHRMRGQFALILGGSLVHHDGGLVQVVAQMEGAGRRTGGRLS